MGYELLRGWLWVLLFYLFLISRFPRMKHAIIYLLLYLLLSPMVYAKNNSKSPTQFIENKGQVTDQHGVVRRDIDAKIEANGVTMFVGDGEIHYQWLKSRESGASGPTPTPLQGGEVNSEVEIYRMDVKLVGANKNAEVVFEEPTGYYESYYLAHTGAEGVTAKGFQRVVYKNIYPNIDLVFYTPPAPLKGSDIANGQPMSNIQHPISNIKYDFIVHPGGNPADIQLRYEGATELRLVDGSLVATTPFGTITEEAPYSYNAGTKQRVASAYKLSGNTLSFDVGSYAGTLVIDPALIWATYFGGTGVEWLNAIDISSNGDIYTCGTVTSSTSNLATTGAYQQVYGGGDRDGIVAKYTEDGQKVWVTYYGGNKQDDLLAIYVDEADNLFITGYTASSGMATNNAHQPGYSGTANNNYLRDALLLKMSPGGQRLWATYYGDTLDDMGTSIVCDAMGHVYMAGYTMSTRYIASNNSHKTTINVATNYSDDGFITKFDTSGNRMWGTYYGGFQREHIYDIDAKADGTICITGRTSSDTGIATPGTLQPMLTHSFQWPQTGESKPFAALFSNAGNMLWGTYIGNDTLNSLGIGTAVHFDETGNIYIAGLTPDRTGIATTGTHQQTRNSTNATGFIVKLGQNGTRLWGSYYGGEQNAVITDVITGIQDAVNIYGSTDDSTGISTTGTWQTKHKGGLSDMFAARLNTTGQRAWGTYYGGTSYDIGGISNIWGSIAYHNNKVFFNFRTTSPGLATPGADKDTVSSGDGMLVCMYVDTIVYIKEPYTDTIHCAGDTLKIPYDVSYKFRGNNTFTVLLSDSLGSFLSPQSIGTRADSVADTIVCVIPRNTPSGQKYKLRIYASAPEYLSDTNIYSLRIKPLPAVQTANNGPVCSGDTLKLFSSGTAINVNYSWSGPNNFSSTIQNPYKAPVMATDSGGYILKVTMNGCYDYDTTYATVKLRPDTPTLNSNSQVCRGTMLQLYATTSMPGVQYNWWGPASFTDTAQNPAINTAGNQHAGIYYATITKNGCTSDTGSTIVIVGINTPTPTAGVANSPLCQRQDLQLTASTITGASYVWYGASAYTANVQNPVRANIQMGDAGKYYVYATINGCVSDTDSVAVVVNTDPFVNIFPTPGATICAGQQVVFTAVPTNGGTTSYNWLVNGITTGSTGSTFNTTMLNNGDIVSCAMTSTGTCATAFIDTSNIISMTVQPWLAPQVTISADAGPSLFPNEPVNFTATATDAGSIPTYQWKRSGADVQGATGSIWGANANFLSDGDEICVLVKSSYACPQPDTALSNCIKLNIRLKVNDLATNNGFRVYPNPVRDVLYVEAPLYLSPKGRGLNFAGEQMPVELVDVMGRKCAITQLLNGSVDVSFLVPGVYVVRVNGVVVGRVVKE